MQRLDLQSGDRVVEFGCGTGLNCALLQAVVGPQGKITGMDVTDGILDKARQDMISPVTRRSAPLK